MKTHYLKTWTQYFEEVWNGKKTFELRKNDRDFAVGDLLVLEEYDPETQEYLPRIIYARVTYILRDVPFGLAQDYCIMAIDVQNQETQP